jgi:hypothetical protein
VDKNFAFIQAASTEDSVVFRVECEAGDDAYAGFVPKFKWTYFHCQGLDFPATITDGHLFQQKKGAIVKQFN